MQAIVNNQIYQLEFSKDGVFVNKDEKSYSISQIEKNIYSIIINGKQYKALLEKVDKENKEITLQIKNQYLNIKIKNNMDLLLESLGMANSQAKKAGDLKAPMPGMILNVKVKAGDIVNKGDVLLILEAMKMENMLKATEDGTVKQVFVQDKQAVEKGEKLISFS